MRAYTHGGGAHRQQISTTFWLGKTLTNFSCATDRIRTSGHGTHWISRPTFYQLSHHAPLCYCYLWLDRKTKITAQWGSGKHSRFHLGQWPKYACTHRHACMQTAHRHRHACIQTAQAQTCTQTHACMHSHLHTHTHACTHTYAHWHTTCKHICMHTHASTYVCIPK